MSVKRERIEDLNTLDALKKYACARYKYQREWYLNCTDCQSRNGCKAGKQAVILMENETRPSVTSEPVMKEAIIADNPELRKRQEIIRIFSDPDPVRKLLESSGNVKPQTVYLRVNTWRKQYPDLEEHYRMLEKVRFLWRKPYDSMRVPDILDELYPDRKEEPQEEKPYKSGVTLMHEIREEAPTQIAPNSKIITVRPNPEATPESEEDSISLEDFLNQMEEEDPGEISEKTGKEEDAMPSGMGDISDTDRLLEKLKEEKKKCEARLQEIDRQMEAVKTVQRLMRAMG